VAAEEAPEEVAEEETAELDEVACFEGSGTRSVLRSDQRRTKIEVSLTRAAAAV
jgi:hypothetical protein